MSDIEVQDLIIKMCDNCKHYDSGNDSCKKYDHETVIEECFEGR